MSAVYTLNWLNVIRRGGDSSLELGWQITWFGDGSPPVASRGKAPVWVLGGRSPPEADAQNCTIIFVSCNIFHWCCYVIWTRYSVVLITCSIILTVLVCICHPRQGRNVVTPHSSTLHEKWGRPPHFSTSRPYPQGAAASSYSQWGSSNVTSVFQYCGNFSLQVFRTCTDYFLLYLLRLRSFLLPFLVLTFARLSAGVFRPSFGQLNGPHPQLCTSAFYPQTAVSRSLGYSDLVNRPLSAAQYAVTYATW